MQTRHSIITTSARSDLQIAVQGNCFQPQIITNTTRVARKISVR